MLRAFREFMLQKGAERDPDQHHVPHNQKPDQKNGRRRQRAVNFVLSKNAGRDPKKRLLHHK